MNLIKGQNRSLDYKLIRKFYIISLQNQLPPKNRNIKSFVKL